MKENEQNVNNVEIVHDFSIKENATISKSGCIDQSKVELKRKLLLSLIKDEQENNSIFFKFGKTSEDQNNEINLSSNHKNSMVSSACEDKKENKPQKSLFLPDSFSFSQEFDENKENKECNKESTPSSIRMIPKRRNNTTDLGKIIASLNKMKQNNG